jgi:hypothetical protein
VVEEWRRRMTITKRPVQSFLRAGAEHAAGVKALFLRNGRADFESTWDVAYPASDASSWIGCDATGSIVMHVALFPCVVGDGRRSWRAGLLGDLMADVEYRDFFGPTQLLRKAAADAKAAGVCSRRQVLPRWECCAGT